MKQKIIVILGPTAVGKTALSVELARSVGGEIISADSRQVYRGLNIGTGKVTQLEMQGVPHHLLDVADPENTFTAHDFVHLGRAAISEIAARGHIPIIVGGTGFYIDALLGRMTLPEVEPDPDLRLKLEGWSLEKLNEELKKLDPEKVKTIDTKNRVRLVRAIEIARSDPESWKLKAKSLYNSLSIGLTLPFLELKERIHVRLLSRLSEGMLKEAETLHANGLSFERMEALGLEYRAMARHIKGEITHEEMLAELEKEIGRYAKRQMTWFKRNKDIQWFRPEQKEEITLLAKKFLV